MKVLWFEISTPSKYKDKKGVLGGWQDSLEEIVSKSNDIELYIAFESNNRNDCVRKINGVTYIPLYIHYSFYERRKKAFSWKVNEIKVIKKGIEIIHQYNPDIIHVFGNEWPFGMLARYTKIPLVVHIQGSIIPYFNAEFPPKYNECTLFFNANFNIRTYWNLIKYHYNIRSRLKMEKRVWLNVSHYMGRTAWDKSLVNILHPLASYHCVNEALRPIFLSTNKRWVLNKENKIKLFSIGCSTLYKGIDVMLKTANILKNLGIDFEWNIAGCMPKHLCRVVEKKEKLRYSDCNINIMGFLQPEKMIDIMCSSTLYVHTSYIDNSPNSICEAQYLGMPVITTMVGGIPSLVRNGIDGDLIPANDPWQLANAIIELTKDYNRMLLYSNNSRTSAMNRHNTHNILNQLLTCYRDIIDNTKSN